MRFNWCSCQIFTFEIAGHSSSSSPEAETSELFDSIKLELEFILEIELWGPAATGTLSDL